MDKISAKAIYPLAADQSEVRIVLVGDKASGKASMINVVAYDEFEKNRPTTFPEIKLNLGHLHHPVKVISVDTNESNANEKMENADVIIVTFCTQKVNAYESLELNWLSKFSKQTNAPVIVAGCKVDCLEETNLTNLKKKMNAFELYEKYPQFERMVLCSARKREPLCPFGVVYMALRSVLFPFAPLNRMNEKFIECLEKIFIKCVGDKQVLDYNNYNNKIQVKCFGTGLCESGFDSMKQQVQGVRGSNKDGLNLEGFKFIYGDLEIDVEHYMKNLETIWTLLCRFGFNNKLDEIE